MPMPMQAGGLYSQQKLPKGLTQIGTLSQPQEQLQNQYINRLQGLLGQGFGQGFEPFAQKARTQFQTQTVPGLAERFTAMGGAGGQRSSAFQGALGQAGAGLEENLAALGQEYGMRQEDLLARLLGQAQQPQFAYHEQQKQAPWYQVLLQALSGGGQGGQGDLSQLLKLLFI
jgi:hypothetical protein